jgi:hypothetical protein
MSNMQHRTLLLLSLLPSLVFAAPADPAFMTAMRDAHPTLSPDGRTLLFESSRAGRWALYTADMDGLMAYILGLRPDDARF